VATGAFALAWNSFVAFWTISAVAGGGLLFGLFSLPFWAAGYQLAKQAFGRQFIRCVALGGRVGGRTHARAVLLFMLNTCLAAKRGSHWLHASRLRGLFVAGSG
jgi:hypothetical protein